MASAASRLKSRFRGSLVGAVAGDCLGAPYECGTQLPEGGTLMSEVVKFMQNLGKNIDKEKGRKFAFTDDTAMARSVAASLIHCKGKYDARDMARRFSEEYLNEPFRGYGGNVIEILPALGDPCVKDIYSPAESQFNGKGSFGNGGGMRIAPVGLCSAENLDRVIEIARESTKLTHSNELGYNGAVLQACAVNFALHADPVTFNPDGFVESLLKVMGRVESDGVYSDKLKRMREMLKTDPTTDDVVEELGNEVIAHLSILSAVYSFLRCIQPVQGIPLENAMERTITYAISLDGDTDTIASMAGAIAGAFYGIEEVPKEWMGVCEGVDDAMEQADQLLDIMLGGD
ncbi:ADP-ribosylhydrolase ARH3-like [Asterias amurensis]|uniref:ADP-ribosylhydrolase ARH3-like n=1 Tax=Asterias amurensis TaxID=7602 RepID=UPI003AB51D67